MFSALKKLFGRSPAPAPAPELSVLPPAETGDSPAGAPSEMMAPPIPEPAAFPAGADPLQVPFAAILQQVPSEYCGKLAPAGVAGCNFAIPKAEVLAQLPRGAVKVTLGELKRGVPEGVFTSATDSDSQLVDLPLSYLLHQLRPQDFAPKSARAQLDAPEEIGDVFGVDCKPEARVRLPRLDEAAPQAAAEAAESSPPPLPEEEKIPLAINFKAAPVEAPAGALTPPQPEAPRTPAGPARAVAEGETSFLLALDEVAVNWPEPVRKEIAQLKVPFAKCALPSPEVCEGLKRGKLEYTWGQLRTQIYPAPSLAGPSPNADTVLTFPLDIVTPLFLDFIRATATSKSGVDSGRVTEFFRRAEQKKAVTQPSIPPEAPVGYPAASALPGATASVAAPNVPVPPAPVSESVPPASAAEPSEPPQVAPPPSAGGALSLPLNLVSGAWPEPVQKEIAKLGLTAARVAIPFPAIEPALRRGKIEYLWSQICAWLDPAPPKSYDSPFGEARLTLPLPVVAPLFLQQKIKKLKTRTAHVPEDIPDLFSGDGSRLPEADAKPATKPPAAAKRREPEADSAPRPKAQPQPTAQPDAVAPRPSSPSPAPPASSRSKPAAPRPPAAAKPPANLAELFGEPKKRKWTPNDIVNKTVEIAGVAGALIALQDGLLVAHRMPPKFKTETIAAFLPQIMGRLNQYAKEFQMGDLNGVTLTVAQGTLQIYHPGSIYFAVLGRPEDALPMEKLDFIATELSRRGK